MSAYTDLHSLDLRGALERIGPRGPVSEAARDRA